MRATNERERSTAARKMEGGNGKDNQEEFELARANFEKTSSVLEKLIKSIAKISDSFKGSRSLIPPPNPPKGSYHVPCAQCRCGP